MGGGEGCATISSQAVTGLGELDKVGPRVRIAAFQCLCYGPPRISSSRHWNSEIYGLPLLYLKALVAQRTGFQGVRSMVVPTEKR